MMKNAVFFAFICSFLGLISTAQANSALQLNSAISAESTSQSVPLTHEQQLEQLQLAVENKKAAETEFYDFQRDFKKTKQDLLSQIEASQKALPINSYETIEQQLIESNRVLTELKESEAELSKANVAGQQRQEALIDEIRKTQEGLVKLQNKLGAIDTPVGQLQHAQRQLLSQQLTTLEAELNTSPERREHDSLNLQLAHAKLQQRERLIESLNLANATARQKQVEKTLADNVKKAARATNQQTQDLIEANIAYGETLQHVTEQTALTVQQQEQAEKRYQTNNAQLANIQEQITWVKRNPVFGERFLQILQSLPKPQDQKPLLTEIADTRLARYQLVQQQAANEQLMTEINNHSTQYQQLKSQQVLLNQLDDAYENYLNALAKLKVKYEALNGQYQLLKSTLNEHLFWVPNAYSMSKISIENIAQMSTWLWHELNGEHLKEELHKLDYYWGWWIILMVTCMALQNLFKPKYLRLMEKYVEPVGNVTQDRVSYTISSLFVSLFYALLKPFPIIVAGCIMLLSEHNTIQALGMGLVAIGLTYLTYQFAYMLTLENGVLVGHFKRPADVVEKGRFIMRRFILFSIPFVSIMGFTETIDSSLVRNSLGRFSFIFFCLLLFLFYSDIIKLIDQYRQNNIEDKNKRVIQKILYVFLYIIPLSCAVLAFRGYYFTAYQLLIQLQYSLLVALFFLILYQILKRWMLIARRRIAFDRAKARRAERMIQREQGEQQTANEVLDTYEEPEVDLETISSQSLGLVRSLLILAFFASLIALWSQTHTALFSFLDGITLWNSSTSINGIEQITPITMKSLLIGIVISGCAFMIATNLPGLLELTILQRLELSPGTGFALTTVSRYLVIFIGIVSGFATLGMDWSKLQWLIAALSLGLGFGLQEIFANFISGLIILFEKPIRIGDTVTIRNLSGTVSKIKIRATTIIDWDRKEIIIPNKAFITEQLVNWSLSDQITRVIIYISVARDSDPSLVEAALYQSVRDCESVLPTPEPEVWFAGFGKCTQDYEVRAFAKDMDSRWPLKHELHKKIIKKLKENQLELAYPQLDISVKNANEATSSAIFSGN